MISLLVGKCPPNYGDGDNIFMKEKGFLKQPGNNNPVMTQHFGADPYAIVYDGRVYLYMTGDEIGVNEAGEIAENTYGDICTIRVISSDDLVNWTDHGAINAAGPKGLATWGGNSWAPAACYKVIDGKTKFFLYFANSGNGIAVLSADSPIGPFVDPINKPLISRETPNCASVEWLFDPAVLVDGDDAYLYVGGGIPSPDMVANPGTARVVKLGDDMISLAEDPKPIENVSYLFEDSGINKINGKYIYTYCSNFNVPEGGSPDGFDSGEIVAMISDEPEGPFEMYGGILKNPGYFFGTGGNNHHCLFEFKGSWYIAYHSRILEDAMDVHGGYRNTNIDKVSFDEDGNIIPIEGTYKGVKALKRVNPYSVVGASTMSNQNGTNVKPYGPVSEKAGYGNMILSDITDGSWISISNVDFGTISPENIFMKVRGEASGSIHVRIDNLTNKDVATVLFEGSKDFCTFESTMMDSIMGVHDVYLVFENGGFELKEWWLE